MPVKAVAPAPRKKTAKAVLSAAVAVISFTTAFVLLYNCNTWTEIPKWLFMPTYVALTALSAFCAAEFFTALFQYSMTKHMLAAATVTLLELAPFPYIWVFSSLTAYPGGDGLYIASMWKTVAVFFAIIMLVMTGVNLLKRKHRLKISVENI